MNYLKKRMDKIEDHCPQEDAEPLFTDWIGHPWTGAENAEMRREHPDGDFFHKGLTDALPDEEIIQRKETDTPLDAPWNPFRAQPLQRGCGPVRGRDLRFEHIRRQLQHSRGRVADQIQKTASTHARNPIRHGIQDLRIMATKRQKVLIEYFYGEAVELKSLCAVRRNSFSNECRKNNEF